MPKVTGCSSKLGCLGVCVAKESGRCGGVGGAKEQGEVPHPTDMKPAPKALPRYTGMAGNKLSNHRRDRAIDRAIACAFAAHFVLRADEPGRVSGERKKGGV
jgi:hypothetical protein